MTEKFRIEADGKLVERCHYFFTAFVKASNYAAEHPDQVVEVVYTISNNVKARFSQGKSYL